MNVFFARAGELHFMLGYPKTRERSETGLPVLFVNDCPPISYSLTNHDVIGNVPER